MKTTLLLVRHATTDAVGKFLSGRSAGMGINDTGKKEVEKLAAVLIDIPVYAIYSSPLQRAIETANSIAKSKGLIVQPDEQFNELDFGDWTGRSIESLVNDPDFKNFNTSRGNFNIPGGENTSTAQKRIIAGLDHLCTLHRNKTLLIVSHADMIRAALTHYLGMPLDLFHRIEISTASISIVEVYDDVVRVIALNVKATLL